MSNLSNGLFSVIGSKEVAAITPAAITPIIENVYVNLDNGYQEAFGLFDLNFDLPDNPSTLTYEWLSLYDDTPYAAASFVACGTPDTATMLERRVTLKPCAISYGFKFCPSDLIYTCYKSLITFLSGDDAGLDNSRAVSLFEDYLVKSFFNNRVRESLAISLFGSFIKQLDVNGFNNGSIFTGTPNLPLNDIQKRAKASMEICTGALDNLLADYRCEVLENFEIPSCNVSDADGRTNYYNSIVSLFERFICCAIEKNKMLGSLINKANGLTTGLGGVLMPVSDSLFSLVAQAYSYQTITSVSGGGVVTQLYSSFAKEMATISGGGNISYYTFRGIPIIPVSLLSYYDRALNGDLLFIGLTTQRNIKLVTTFAKTVNGALPVSYGDSDIQIAGMQIYPESNSANTSYIVEGYALIGGMLETPENFIWDAAIHV